MVRHFAEGSVWIVHLAVTQRTRCRYSRPVQFARIEYRVFPAGSAEQNVIRLNVAIEPDSERSDFTDAWGNLYRKAEWPESLDGWTLSVDLFVQTLMDNPFAFAAAAADAPVPDRDFPWPPETAGYRRWEYDPWDNEPAVEAWAREISAPVRGAFKKIQALVDAIHRQFKFCKGMTDVKTPPAEILRLKVGVCQDFSTLLIAAARTFGLQARYVSGYIYEGPKSNRAGSAPSGHGWAEVYFPDIGWRGFDPLNGILACQTHVRVAQGRWYADAAPIGGRFIGAGVTQTTETEITVDKADASGRSIEP